MFLNILRCSWTFYDVLEHSTMFYIFPHVHIRCTWLYYERLVHTGTERLSCLIQHIIPKHPPMNLLVLASFPWMTAAVMGQGSLAKGISDGHYAFVCKYLLLFLDKKSTYWSLKHFVWSIDILDLFLSLQSPHNSLLRDILRDVNRHHGESMPWMNKHMNWRVISGIEASSFVV